MALELVPLRTPRGRAILAATVLASALTMLDATIANVALPRISIDLGTDVTGLQWVINGYALPLASFILLGGALGDRFGRRRVFLIGLAWFGAASIICAIAPTLTVLLIGRALQGVGGALITPGSLALIEASFVVEDRGRAVGAWSGIGGLAAAVGPFVGGAIVDGPGWRWAFLLNVPFALVVFALSRTIPESKSTGARTRFDGIGAAFVALGLGGLTWAFTEAGVRGWDSPLIIGPLIIGVGFLVAFVVRQLRISYPLVPPSLFASRSFTTTNIATLFIYAALGVEFLFLVYQLQVSAGWSATEAGTALLPATLVMFLLSSRSGALAQKIGPRLQLIVGPCFAAAGLLFLSRIDSDVQYVYDVLPGALLMGLGFATFVPPLVATVMGSVDRDHVSIASGINNAIARTASLLAVATIPVVSGLATASGTAEITAAFRTGMIIAAALALAGGIICAIGLPRHARIGKPLRTVDCAVTGPPAEPDPRQCPEAVAAGGDRSEPEAAP